MSEPTIETWNDNEEHWKKGYTVSFHGIKTKLCDMDEDYILNCLRFYRDWDTRPLKQELVNRWIQVCEVRDGKVIYLD